MSDVGDKRKGDERNGQQHQHRQPDDVDWKLPIAFNKPRHTATIEGVNCITQTWRMKERVSYLDDKKSLPRYNYLSYNRYSNYAM